MEASDVTGDLMTRLRFALSKAKQTSGGIDEEGSKCGVGGNGEKTYQSVLDILSDINEIMDRPSYYNKSSSSSTSSIIKKNNSSSGTSKTSTPIRYLLPLIVCSMKYYHGKKLVQLRSILIITSFVKHSIGMKYITTKRSVIQSVLSAMRQHGLYYPVQISSCKLLDLLFAKAGNAIFSTFNEEGGMDCILQASGNFRTCISTSRSTFNGTITTTSDHSANKSSTTRTTIEKLTTSILTKLGKIVRSAQGAQGHGQDLRQKEENGGAGAGINDVVADETVCRGGTASAAKTSVNKDTPTSSSTTGIDSLIADIVGLRLAALEVENPATTVTTNVGTLNNIKIC